MKQMTAQWRNLRNMTEGFEVDEIQQPFTESGNTEVTGDDIHDWLEMDSLDQGHSIRTNEEIVTNVELSREEILTPDLGSEGDVGGGPQG